MAFPNSKTLLALIVISNILLAITHHGIAGRETPKNSKNVDMKQPQFFIDRDGSFLVPGVGRFMFPKDGHGFNPYTYNPVTGTSGGGPAGGTGGGDSGSGTGGAGATHSYVPGGDDTLLPNPGVEVPSGGGSPSAPASP